MRRRTGWALGLAALIAVVSVPIFSGGRAYINSWSRYMDNKRLEREFAPEIVPYYQDLSSLKPLRDPNPFRDPVDSISEVLPGRFASPVYVSFEGDVAFLCRQVKDLGNGQIYIDGEIHGSDYNPHGSDYRVNIEGFFRVWPGSSEDLTKVFSLYKSGKFSEGYEDNYGLKFRKPVSLHIIGRHDKNRDMSFEIERVTVPDPDNRNNRLEFGLDKVPNQYLKK